MTPAPDDPARYRQLMSLFDRAIEIPIADRPIWLARIQSEEPSLADELAQLLIHDGTCNDVFDSHGERLEIGLANACDVLARAPGGNEDISNADPLLNLDLGGRYRLEQRIGAGGMGQVYRAFDRIEERVVAIKLLRPELAGDERQVERFRREFRAVSRLMHPGCITMFAEGSHLGRRYIVMEYVHGGSLERLSQGRPTELLPILITLANTLDYVHENRILHRDLKPANILLVPGEPLRPKLADFGIVHLGDDEAGRLTDTGAILGSIDFMAPEQIEGKPLDSRCDLYSFGGIIYSLWTGSPPFSGTPLQRLRARFESEAPSLRIRVPHAPPRLDALVARLLRRNRSERPDRARDVARELEKILAELHGVRMTNFEEKPLVVTLRDPTSCELAAEALLGSGKPRDAVTLLRSHDISSWPVLIRARWLRKLGIALLRTSELTDGLSTLEQALALLDDEVPQKQTRRRVRILANLLGLVSSSVIGGAGQEAEDVERAIIHRELSVIHRWIDIERAVYHQVAFARLAFRLNIKTFRTEAYLGIAFMCSLRAWSRTATRYYRKTLALARETSDTSGLARYAIVLGGLKTSIGHDNRTAMAHFDEGLRLAKSIGDVFLTTFASSMRGWAATLLSYPEQAKNDFQRASDAATELDIPWLRDDAACGSSLIDLLQGNFESATSRVRSLLASDIRLALPLFEALPTEILGVEALLSGRYRDAVILLERARTHYLTHNLYRGWGTFAKLMHSEALVCWAEEVGARNVPDFLQRLRANTKMGQRMSRLWVFRGWGALLTGVEKARRGNEKAARRLFDRALAERGPVDHPSFMDHFFKIRIALERLHLGDSKDSITRILDQINANLEVDGFLGIRRSLERLRNLHQV
jgi:serine/threonine protein kinase